MSENGNHGNNDGEVIINVKNLHKKFCHGIDIPDGHRLLYPVEPLLVLRRQNPEAQSRHPIGL